MKRATIVLLAVGLLVTSCATSEQRLAEKQDKDPQYQYEKAVVCMNAGLTDEALKYLDRALALDPNHASSLNLRGLALMIKGQPQEAVLAFEKCIKISPEFSDGHNNLATALLQKGETDRAEEEFRRALAIDGNYNASFNLAKIAFQKGQLDAALDYVQRSIRKYNRSLLAFNLQGLVLESQNKLDDAIASYEAGLRIVPDEPNVTYNLGVAYYKQQNFEKCKTLMEKVQRLLRDKPSANPSEDSELKKRVEDVLKRLAAK